MAANEYSWTNPYRSALFELSFDKLLDQIAQAEVVIQKRRMQLLQSSQTGDELNAIDQALKVLNQLREISLRRL